MGVFFRDNSFIHLRAALQGMVFNSRDVCRVFEAIYFRGRGSNGGRVFFADHGILAERAAVSGPLNVALMHRRASLDIHLCSCGDSGQSM